MISKTITLQPNVETIVELQLDNTFNDFAITNTSFTDIWVNLDKTVTVEGDGCVLVKANSFRTLGSRGNTIHLISKSSAKVEVQGLGD